jgi:ABC-type polysaccharide/polyol phosphate export permease
MRWRPLSVVNPMTMPVEAMRRCLIGAGSPELGAYLISAGVTAALLLSGLAVFQKVERTFVDVI